MTMTGSTTDKPKISERERTELRRLVRIKVKLLRSEIETTHADRMAEIDRRVAERFCDNEARRQELQAKLDRIVATANRRAAALFAQYADVAEPRFDVFRRPWFSQPQDGRTKLRAALIAAVQAQTQAARHEVTKLEDRLLSDLSLRGVQSDAGLTFANAVPTVDSLMPAGQLAEIEAKFDQEDQA